jgi:hypothetical protein
MSRVWKKFLLKVGKGAAFVSYVVGSMVAGGFIAEWLIGDPDPGIFAGAFIFVILPMIVSLLRDIYRDTKAEVERENRELMRTLGKNID